MCFLLGIRSAEQLRNHPLRGAIFEGWVASEVRKSRVHHGVTPSLYFFRDRKGTEVDLVVEHADGLVAIETKSAETVASDFFTGLNALTELAFTRKPPCAVSGFVVYGGAQTQIRSSATVLSWSDIDRRDWVDRER